MLQRNETKANHYYTANGGASKAASLQRLVRKWLHPTSASIILRDAAQTTSCFTLDLLCTPSHELINNLCLRAIYLETSVQSTAPHNSRSACGLLLLPVLEIDRHDAAYVLSLNNGALQRDELLRPHSDRPGWSIASIVWYCRAASTFWAQRKTEAFDSFRRHCPVCSCGRTKFQ